MRLSFLVSLIFVALTVCHSLINVSSPQNLSTFKTLPILHEGRVMPMDTFARRTLLTLHGKQTLGNTSAAEWLKYTLLFPEKTYTTPLIYIPNRALVQSLDLPLHPKNHYSFQQVAHAFAEKSTLLENAKHTPEDARSTIQRDLIALTIKHSLLFDISRSLTLFAPEKQMSLDHTSTLFKVIPPASQNPFLTWQSPWEASKSAQPLTQEQHNTMLEWKEALNTKSFSHLKKHNHADASEMRLKLETFYHTLDPIKISLGFYLSALLLGLLAVSLPRKTRTLYTTIHTLLCSGLWLHLMAIVIRITLTGRAPIATLYESIITTSLIAVLGFIYIYRKNPIPAAILAGSTGALFHFISFKFAYSADSFGVLVAVLNTNFWLSTHVTTMIIGYGLSFMSALLSLWYLLERCRGRTSLDTIPILNMTISVMLFALLFSTLGTVLGGIWADQSWGRFWGWDPKENGALFLVLWLTWLLHGRLKAFGSLLFAAGGVFTLVVLALAWFGVNLLGVGLHSYGFTSGIAWKLTAFCVTTTALTLTLWAIGLYKEKTG